MQPIIMPQIGQDVETGVITRWTKKVGDPVRKGEVVATVEGDKAAFDIESPADGVLLQIAVEAGQEGRVLGPVGFVGAPGEKPADAQAPRAAPSPSAPPAAQVAVDAAAAAGPVSPQRTGRVFSSPAARRVASERGVDIGSLTGSGPGGRIMKKDVLAARAAPQGRQPAPLAVGPTVPAGRTAPEPAASPAARAGEDIVVPHTRMRQIIADRLTQSKQTIPHFYLFQDVDVEEALQWRELYNARNGCKVTVTDMVVWAVAATLREFPRINAHVEKDGLIARGRINVGVAAATDDGLLVPVIPDTDQKDIRALSAEIKAKAGDARKGKLDLGVKGTFTVTSLGMFGTQSFLPIINPPEAAILGVGAAEPRPVAVGNMLGVHRVMTLTLSCDHRAVNGAEAAKFLKRLEQTIRSRFVPAA